MQESKPVEDSQSSCHCNESQAESHAEPLEAGEEAEDRRDEVDAAEVEATVESKREVVEEDYLATLPRSTHTPLPPPARRSAADWNQLAAELGLEVPPEPEPSPVESVRPIQEEPVSLIEELTPPFQTLESPSEILSEVSEEEEEEEEETLEASAEEPSAAAPEAGEERRGRRRKRRRRSRRDESRSPPSAEVVEPVAEETAEAAPAAEEAAEEEAVEGEEKEAPPRKHRRRRRGADRRKGREARERSGAREASNKSESEGEPVLAGVPAGEAEHADEEDHDDEHGSDKAAHKAIPSWTEAINFIVNANLESRAKNPDRRSSRQRGNRHGGHGRSSDRGD